MKENNQLNQLRDKTVLLVPAGTEERFSRELYSFFGKTKGSDYVLKTIFLEKKENRIVKTNQVAEKIDYELNINYELFYKNRNCKIHNKNIVSKFSFIPMPDRLRLPPDDSYKEMELIPNE